MKHNPHTSEDHEVDLHFFSLLSLLMKILVKIQQIEETLFFFSFNECPGIFIYILT